jgi:hypothetical protein
MRYPTRLSSKVHYLLVVSLGYPTKKSELVAKKPRKHSHEKSQTCVLFWCPVGGTSTLTKNLWMGEEFCHCCDLPKAECEIGSNKVKLPKVGSNVIVLVPL